MKTAMVLFMFSLLVGCGPSPKETLEVGHNSSGVIYRFDDSNAAVVCYMYRNGISCVGHGLK